MMKKVIARPKLIIVLLAILLAVPTIVLAQDDEPDKPITECNPAAQRIVAQFDVTCDDVLEQVNAGYGFGQIMKALYISNSSLSGDDTWQDLLVAQETSGIGWGQYKMALRFEKDGVSAQQLLDWKTSGYGWGQIKKAIAIANVAEDATVDQVLTMMKDDMEWDAIRDALGLPPGKPPWAGNGKFGSNDGPPGLSGAKGQQKGNKQTGPPEWANNDKGTG